MAAWAAIGAGLAALGGLASSALSNSANASMDEATRDWQEKMWTKTNWYNRPSEQVARLREAGINPALAFQNGSAGALASSPSAVQHTPANFSDLGTGISSAVSSYLQSQSVNANTDLLRSQTEGNRIDNLTRLSKNLAEIESMIQDARQKGANTSYLEWQRDQSMALFDALSKRNYAEIENIRQDTLLKGTQMRKESALADYQTILNRYGVQNQEKVLRNLDAQYQEILSAVANNNASAAYALAQKALTGVNEDTAKKVQKYVVDRAFQEVEAIKDDRELKWLQEHYRQTGKAGEWFSAPVPQYKVGLGLKRAERQRNR